MHADTAALLAPSGPELALLFEASRILNRHADPADAMAPLADLLESVGRFERVELLLAGSAAGLPGLDSRPFGPLLAAGEARVGPGWAAAPALLRGSPAALVAVFLRSGLQPASSDLSLVEGLAALLSEALALRARFEESLRARDDKGPMVAGVAKPGQPSVDRARGAAELGELLGVSQAMAQVKAFIERVAPTDSTVLITGESGTGKELAARAVHRLSRRAVGPFVAVNCAALPEALIESELFGHERGAFTGAHARRLGRFELAAGGTIFLDEVAELPIALQAKLLRVLQERCFERVGGSLPVRADVRVIAATNRDLEREVVESRFRADLYWRLNVFPLRMPPLRERGGDVVLLADHFTGKYAGRTGRPVSRISTPALDLLTSYHWPGNVRELENAIERAVVLSTDGVIHAYHLPPSLQSAESTGTGPGSTLDAALARLERELLVEALKMEGGNAAAAARRLGVTERRMGLALKRYGIDWRRFRRDAAGPAATKM
jgi:Nif-specific regulatory protein